MNTLNTIIYNTIYIISPFVLWIYISKTKAYIEEKAKLSALEEKTAVLTTIAEEAKNAVTKKDIEDITQKIESVKNVFSSALEKYKVDLQKKFEIDKYTIDLCKKYDSELIGLLQNHIYNTNTNGCKSYDEFNYDGATNSLSKLSDFLCDFNHRYGDHPDVERIIDLDRDYKKIAGEPEDEIEELELKGKDPRIIEIEKNDIFNKSRHSASKILNYFLPKLDFSTMNQES